MLLSQGFTFDYKVEVRRIYLGSSHDLVGQQLNRDCFCGILVGSSRRRNAECLRKVQKPRQEQSEKLIMHSIFQETNHKSNYILTFPVQSRTKTWNGSAAERFLLSAALSEGEAT